MDISACRLLLINTSPNLAPTFGLKATGKKQKLSVIIIKPNFGRKFSVAAGPDVILPNQPVQLKQTSWVRLIINV